MHQNPLKKRSTRPFLAAALLASCAAVPTEQVDAGDVDAGEPDAGVVVKFGLRSADDFDANESGIVTGSTLRRWLDDWETQRPAGLTGGLVVLQLDAADDVRPWLASRDGVRAYHASELDRLLEERNSGVLSAGTVPGRGVRVDSYLRRYGIHPDEDLVLLATGRASIAGVAHLARAWLTLRYWGVPPSHLAMLDGDVASATTDDDRTDTAPVPPIDGEKRVTTLPGHAFELHATLGDVIGAIEGGTRPWDLRTREAFDAAIPDAVPNDDTCLLRKPSCTTTFGGRIAGARQVELDTFFDPETARFKGPGTIDDTLDAAGLDRSEVPLLYDADGTRSALAAFALLAIVGVDVRWYAAGLAEWGVLNASHPAPALRILPADSPWRTDLPTRSEALQHWASADVAARSLAIGPRAARADRVRTDDLTYLRTAPALPAPGAGETACE